MSDDKTVLGLVGSPNKQGRTNQLVSAALEGAAQAGAPVELIHLADHVVQPCRDCLPWVCQSNLKCSFPDEAFELLSGKLLSCGALALGSPVYWWDVSGLVKYLMLKMFRVHARGGPLNGLPALGLAIAGGTGNGLISGLRPVYHFLQILQMRPLAPVPATRFDFDQALARAREQGAALAGQRNQRQPFASVAERLSAYDRLPYLGLDRFQERRLLAGLVCAALPPEAGLSQGLARAEALRAAGDSLAALEEIGRVYDAGVELFEKL
ncbi:MAG: flavodoxin family protein [Desulfarculaceae bacterium]|nr:flavodoxin family protein [Desulfarculaceae bacterium]MCF8071575.1 flavodoxin family protein [Desulfarculaceae bacterium]MCF8102390.1 flavodoxin family protein [Desulfarculaceae bacterium]MCF8114854.1 flavodoxin family protein [Desulfarculaceae bacterium]